MSGFVGRFVLGPGLTFTLHVLLLGSAAEVTRHLPEGPKYLRPLMNVTGRDLGAPSSPGPIERWSQGVP